MDHGWNRRHFMESVFVAGCRFVLFRKVALWMWLSLSLNPCLWSHLFPVCLTLSQGYSRFQVVTNNKSPISISLKLTAYLTKLCDTVSNHLVSPDPVSGALSSTQDVNTFLLIKTLLRVVFIGAISAMFLLTCSCLSPIFAEYFCFSMQLGFVLFSVCLWRLFIPAQ